MKNLIFKKSGCGAAVQILFGAFLGLFVFQSASAFPVAIISDTSPTTIAQIQQQAQQTTLQSSIAVDQKQSRIQQYLEYAREAERWMTKIQQHAQLVTQNIQRFTSLKGVLSVVEKELGLSDDTLKALSDIGQAIRATLSLKNQFVNMIRSQLSMIESLEQRARNGIFDPQADLNDLEDYLKRTMGKEARAVLLSRERLAKVNPELTKLTEEWQKVRARRIGAEKEKKELEDKLARELQLSSSTRQVTIGDDGASTVQTGSRVSTSSDAVAATTARIGTLELLINDLLKQERELEEKIQAIYAKAHARFDDVYFTGEKWTDYMDGWTALRQSKNEAITGLIDSYGNRPRTVPTTSPTP